MAREIDRLFGSKRILARMLAKESLDVVISGQATTAMIDLKNRKVIIPNFKNDISDALYNLFVGHEVAHAVDTPPEEYGAAAAKYGIPSGLVNIAEDVRIEKRQKRRYPGMKPYFVQGYKELIEKHNFFNGREKLVNEQSFADKINIFAKLGVAVGAKFPGEEQAIVDELFAAETFDEAMAAAVKVWEYMKRQKEKDRAKGEGGSEEGEADSRQHNATGVEKPEKELIQTDKDISGVKDLFAQTNISTYTIPEPKMENILIPWQDFLVDVRAAIHGFVDSKDMLPEYESFHAASNPTVSYLVKEFELRKNAKELAKVTHTKTGQIDPDKLASFKFNDDIFLRACPVPAGKSHGLQLFIDWSSSMRAILHSTFKQVLNITDFCRKENIPFEVYAFSDNPLLVTADKPAFDVEEKAFKNFRLVNILSSTMKVKVYTEACASLLFIIKNNIFNGGKYALHSTPLNEAIIAASVMVPEFQRNRRLDVVNAVFLTDGGANPTLSRECNVYDPKLRMHFKIDYNRNPETKVYLDILRERADCNAVGFYLCHSVHSVRDIAGRYSVEGQLTKMEKQWLNEGSCIVYECGYNEYYLINQHLTQEVDKPFQVVDDGGFMPSAQVDSFIKHRSKRLINKVMLTSFIKQIS